MTSLGTFHLLPKIRKKVPHCFFFYESCLLPLVRQTLSLLFVCNFLTVIHKAASFVYLFHDNNVIVGNWFECHFFSSVLPSILIMTQKVCSKRKEQQRTQENIRTIKVWQLISVFITDNKHSTKCTAVIFQILNTQ